MNPFVETLSRGTALGTFVMSASPLIAEAIGWCGFDFVIVDGEHSPIDTMDAAQMLQAVGATPTVPVFRVSWNDTVTVKRMLDAGASTLLFPFIQSGAEAEAAVRATRYPPEGIRGMAGLTRASHFGAVKDHFRTANDRIAVIAQLETTAALDRLEEIAAVPGIDALFVGPTDLSGSMGLHGDSSHPDVRKALADAVRRCQAIGKPLGTLGATTELSKAYIEAGFSFVVASSDLGFLTGQARNVLASLRQQERAPGAASY